MQVSMPMPVSPQVLAAGLSALYSSLPRRLEVPGDEWHRLRRRDWLGVAPLVLFINSLEFCNAVLQVPQGGSGEGCRAGDHCGARGPAVCLAMAMPLVSCPTGRPPPGAEAAGGIHPQWVPGARHGSGTAQGESHLPHSPMDPAP